MLTKMAFGRAAEQMLCTTVSKHASISVHAFQNNLHLQNRQNAIAKHVAQVVHSPCAALQANVVTHLAASRMDEMSDSLAATH